MPYQYNFGDHATLKPTRIIGRVVGVEKRVDNADLITLRWRNQELNEWEQSTVSALDIEPYDPPLGSQHGGMSDHIPEPDSPEWNAWNERLAELAEANGFIDNAELREEPFFVGWHVTWTLPVLIVHPAGEEAFMWAPREDTWSHLMHFYNSLDTLVDPSYPEQSLRHLREQAYELPTPHEHYEKFHNKGERSVTAMSNTSYRHINDDIKDILELDPEPAFDGTPKEGWRRKFTVINERDVRRYLTDDERHMLDHTVGKLQDRISEQREYDGKEPHNNYLVINMDEPYTDEVIAILKKHGDWQ